MHGLFEGFWSVITDVLTLHGIRCVCVVCEGEDRFNAVKKQTSFLIQSVGVI